MIVVNRKKKRRRKPNPMRLDPTRTLTLRKQFATDLRKRFARLRYEIHKLIVEEDALGIGPPRVLSFNAFCPTGEGGGVDPTCGPGGSSGGDSSGGGAAKAKGWLAKAAELPAAAWGKIKAKVGKVYEKLEKRYGSKHAKVILAAGIAGLPVPIPFSTAITAAPFIAIAEMHRAFSRGPAQNEAAEMTEEEIRQAAAELFAELQRELSGLTANAHQDWRFRSSPDKVRAFQEWLRQQARKDILGATPAQLWQRYVEAGFRRGAARAFDDTRRSERARASGAEELRFYQGTRDEFLRSAFARPVAVDKVKLLAGRVYSDLEGVTEQMATRMTRVLTDGLVQGKGPREVARDLADELEEIGTSRALAIARTECLPGDTLVDGAVVRAIFRRFYEGDLVEIVTCNGRKFSATPNHPMLTKDGWVAAAGLKKGDELICHNGQKNPSSSRNQHVPHRPATLSQVFDSLQTVGISERRRSGKPDFHGDGLEGEVDVLRPHRELAIGNFSSLHEELVQDVFSPAGQALSRFCHACRRLLSVNEQPCLCRGAQRDTHGHDASFDCASISTGGGGQRFQRGACGIAQSQVLCAQIIAPLVGGSALLPRKSLSRGVAAGHAFLPQDFADLFLLGTHPTGDFPLRHSSKVQLDDVISVRTRPFSGHVYNLETPFGYFTIDGAYTGNTIRAHAEGQLQALEDLGVEEVGAMVEWSTAGDEIVCPSCQAMEGVVLKLSEAHGKIPLHPGCRCAWIPANVGEEPEAQKRSKSAIEEAADEAGIDVEVSFRRPAQNALLEFSRFLHNVEPS